MHRGASGTLLAAGSAEIGAGDCGQKQKYWPHSLTTSARNRTEFGLDALGSGDDVIRAIRELSYKGGNTRTGAAILHVADHIFLPQLARPGIPKVTPNPTTPPQVPSSAIYQVSLTPAIHLP